MKRSLPARFFGAIPVRSGFRFFVWAPAASSVDLHLRQSSGATRVTPMQVFQWTGKSREENARRGAWVLDVPDAVAGDRYAFSLDGKDPRPDPAARFLPDGVHGWAEVVDPTAFQWTDDAWPGLDPRRAVIYELHVGTFTPEGTFRAAIGKLPYLRDLGVTAIEIMPVGDFAGQRNWGYDGVALFAPSRAYGRPDDLRALVDAAHAHGIGVIMDVVYNHVGPEGAYLEEVSPPFFTDKHRTPWGSAVNLDDPQTELPRLFLLMNTFHWLSEYHVDGLRLDATHALFDTSQPHFVANVAYVAHTAATPPALVYAEDHRNLAAMVEVADAAGWDLDGVWADDFHHVIRTMLAGDRHGYYVDYEGTAGELAETLRKGWLYTGQYSKHERAPRGTDPAHVPLRKAVVCVQNHDQVGNRALGDRLHHQVDPASWRAAVAVLLTAPMTPLLFMGQEWATTAPFQFFTDFCPELGQQVVEGRRREFKAFPEFSTEEGAKRVPDPQADATFEASKLRWQEIDRPEHARVLALHRALLQLRAAHPQLQASDACCCDAEAVDNDTVVVHREDGGGSAIVVVARLRGSGRVSAGVLRDAGELLLDTEDARFAEDPTPPRIDRADGTIEFSRPGAVVFSR